MLGNYIWDYFEICEILNVKPKLHKSFNDIFINKLWYYLNESDENTLFIHYQKEESEKYLIDEALKKGCLVLTSMDISNYPDDSKIIKVSSVLESVRRIAAINRERFLGNMIAITGSVGKSSVKDLTSQLLSIYGPTYSVLKNENGTLGVNTILSSIPKEFEYAVLEVSASGPNTIFPRAELIRADIGIVTNAAYNHMIKYSNSNELRKEKLALLDCLAGKKIAIINRNLFEEDFLNEKLLSKKKIEKLIVVGDSVNDDIQLIDYKLTAINTSAIIRIGEKKFNVFLPVPGKHFIETAMFSLAVIFALNLDIEKAVEKCRSFTPPLRRNQRFKVNLNNSNGVFELIDDAINASPISVNSLLDLVSIRKNVNRKVLIFGDMLELGNEDVTRKLHLELKDKIITSGINYFIGIGTYAKELSDELKNIIPVTTFKNSNEANEKITSLINDKDLVVVKGSGAMKLNMITAKLKGKQGQYEAANQWTIES